MTDKISAEQELLRTAIAGDRRAAEKLFLRYFDELTSHLNRKLPQDLPGPVNVEDVAQQSFVKAFKGITSLRSTSTLAFVAWLKTIATNQLRDVLRRKQLEQLNRARRPLDAHDIAASTFRILLERVDGESPIPTDVAMQHELMQALDQAMAALTEEYRTAIQLRYITGLTLDEVAAKMERSTGAVRALCYRGKQQLKDELVRLSNFI